MSRGPGPSNTIVHTPLRTCASRAISATIRRAAPVRSRHQPSARDPITLLPSTKIRGCTAWFISLLRRPCAAEADRQRSDARWRVSGHDDRPHTGTGCVLDTCMGLSTVMVSVVHAIRVLTPNSMAFVAAEGSRVRGTRSSASRAPAGTSAARCSFSRRDGRATSPARRWWSTAAAPSPVRRAPPAWRRRR